MNKSKPKFYRNAVPVAGIDPWALWERRSNTMVLVDEDQHLTTEYSADEFEVALQDDFIESPEANDEG